MIVNADSAQVYADLRILSARPDPEDTELAEHRLFGHRDGGQACSAASWAEEAREVIADVHGRGQLPILVGGTGLYLRALLDGIAPIPPVHPPVRAEVRAARAGHNHRRLAVLDPVAAARLHPNDSQRVARALEVVLSSGRTLASWQARTVGGMRDEVGLFGVRLEPKRASLDPVIDQRFSDMIAQGGMREVERLIARDLCRRTGGN